MTPENQKTCIICNAVEGVTYVQGIATQLPEIEICRLSKHSAAMPPEKLFQVHSHTLESYTARMAHFTRLAPHTLCNNCLRVIYQALHLGLIENTLVPPYMLHSLETYKDFEEKHNYRFTDNREPIIRKIINR